jgi:hypothetical protein
MLARSLAVIACVAVSVGAALAEETRIVTQSPPQGRFQIVFGPFARADAFMLDTQTGQVWQLTKYTDMQGEPLVWTRMPRLDSADEIATFYRANKKVTPTTQPATAPKPTAAAR